MVQKYLVLLVPDIDLIKDFYALILWVFLPYEINDNQWAQP